MLSVAHREDIDLEGACEGSLACSTCHVVIADQGFFDKIPEADDDENDMLDLAFGLTQTYATSVTVQCNGQHTPLSTDHFPRHSRTFLLADLVWAAKLLLSLNSMEWL